MHDRNADHGQDLQDHARHDAYDEEAVEADFLYAADAKDVPYEVQLELFETGRFDVHEYQCTNPHTHPDILRRLGENKGYWAFLIRNPSLPEDLLELILIDYFAEVSPAAVLGHPNATEGMRDMELARQQNEEGPDPDQPGENLDPSHTSEPPYTYDPLQWASGKRTRIEEDLWFKHESYAENYAIAEPDTSELQNEWLLELWTAQLRFTPDYVLARITSKLAARLEARARKPGPYDDVRQVARDLAASDPTPHLRRVLAHVATHPDTPASALKEIINTGDLGLITLVAKSGNTGLPDLKRILEIDGTAHAVAQHNSPKVQKLLSKLLPLLDTRGRALLAANRNLRGMDLEELEDTSSPLVLAALASNPNYSLKVIDRLADNPNPLIRLGAATNHKAPTHTLLRLSCDPEDNVVKAVAANPGANATILTQLYEARPDTHEDLAKNRKLPAALIDQLRWSEDPLVKRALAGNGSTQPEVLDGLIQTEDRMLHFYAANHPNTGPGTLDRLRGESPWFPVRLAARRRVENEQGALYTPDRYTKLQQEIRATLNKQEGDP